jgi:hypothetical protein
LCSPFRGSIAVVILSVIFWKKFRLITRVYIWEGAIIGTLLIAAYSFQTFGLAGSTPERTRFLRLFTVFSYRSSTGQ